MDLVRHLECFVAVAEESHFGRAATRLGMAQPPLSQRIQRLEKELGVRLFERTSRQVAITEAGTLLLAEARELLARAESLRTAARRIQITAATMPTIRPTRGPEEAAGAAACRLCGASSTNARNIWVLPAGSLVPWGPWVLAMGRDTSESASAAQVRGRRALLTHSTPYHLRIYFRNTCLCQLFIPHRPFLFACSN